MMHSNSHDADRLFETPSNSVPIEPMEERIRWRSRDATYWAGKWDKLSEIVPRFELADFRAGPGNQPNPYMKSVVRLPRTQFEQPVPVGVVSNNYGLAQHHEVVEKCFDGIRVAGVDPNGLRCELGLTELGEWMNFRIYFPEDYDYERQVGDRMGLRVECFNTVDGSGRLMIMLGWLRFVCTNGMVIGETKTELRDIHNERLNIDRIAEAIADGMKLVKNDLKRMGHWDTLPVYSTQIREWADADVSKTWGRKAACRVYHICDDGYDVEITDPFAKGEASEKPCKRTQRVPGSPERAGNLFDVSQAMSWVATGRTNPEERLAWQSEVPRLVDRLAKVAGKN